MQNRVYCKLWRLEYKHKKGAYYVMKEIEQKFSQMSPSFHYKESVVSKVREIESSPSPPNWGNGKWASEWTQFCCLKVPFLFVCLFEWMWRLECKLEKGAFYAIEQIEQILSQMSPIFHYKDSIVSKVREIESSPSPPNWGNGKWASKWTQLCCLKVPFFGLFDCLNGWMAEVMSMVLQSPQLIGQLFWD